MVRDPDKVMVHLMFGISALFADQLLKIMGGWRSETERTDDEEAIRLKSEQPALQMAL